MTTLSQHLTVVNASRDTVSRNKAVDDLLADFPDFGDFSSRYQNGSDIDARANRLRTLQPYCWTCIGLVAEFKVTHDGHIQCRDCEIREMREMAPQEPEKYGALTMIATADILRRAGNTLKAEIFEHRAWRGDV